MVGSGIAAAGTDAVDSCAAAAEWSHKLTDRHWAAESLEANSVDELFEVTDWRDFDAKFAGQGAGACTWSEDDMIW